MPAMLLMAPHQVKKQMPMAPACGTNLGTRSAPRTARSQERTRIVEGLPTLGIPSIRPARNAARKGSGGVRIVTSKAVVLLIEHYGTILDNK